MVVRTNKIIVTNSAGTSEDANLEISGGALQTDVAVKYGSSAFAVNGSRSMSIVEGSSLGPNAAIGGNVSKWLSVKDETGSTLYIPAWM